MPPSAMMSCRSCGAPLSPDGGALFVVCRHCGGLERLSLGAHERPDAPRTERLRLERTPEGIRITYRWISQIDWLLALMSMVLLLPFALFASVLLIGSYRRQDTLLGTFATAALGLFVAYGLSRLARSTVFEVRRGELIVRRRPPLTRNLYFKGTEIQQLVSSQEAYVVQRQGHQQEYRAYGLSVVLKDGLRVKLQGHMPEAGDPLFIEQQVERALGLADRPLAGEIPR